MEEEEGEQVQMLMKTISSGFPVIGPTETDRQTDRQTDKSMDRLTQNNDGEDNQAVLLYHYSIQTDLAFSFRFLFIKL